MKIKATDPEASKVKHVRVDGKLVEMPVEFDTEEGWVKCLVPVLPVSKEEEVQEIFAAAQKTVDPGEDVAYADWDILTLTGKVEVEFHE